MKFIITFTVALKHQPSRKTPEKKISDWKLHYTIERIKGNLNNVSFGLDSWVADGLEDPMLL